jgi:hypothetical protein
MGIQHRSQSTFNTNRSKIFPIACQKGFSRLKSLFKNHSSPQSKIRKTGLKSSFHGFIVPNNPARIKQKCETIIILKNNKTR